MTKRFICGLLVGCLTVSAWAQDEGSGDDTPPNAAGGGTGTSLATSGSAAFLRLGVGARAQGMGRAFTAFTAADPSAPFWNPAGLGLLGKPMGSFSGRAMSDSAFDTRFFSGTGAMPLGPGALGISLLQFSVGDIEAYDEKAQFLGLFKNSEFAISGSYGITQGPVSLGVGIRYLSQKFNGDGLTAQASESNNGFGFDVGMLYTPTSKLYFGLMLRDGTDIGDVDHMPAGFTVGTGYVFHMRQWGNPAPIVRVGLDLEQIEKRPLRLHLGSELEMMFDANTTGFLRLGISDFFLESRSPGGSAASGILSSERPGGQSKLTLGLGVIWNQYGLDLAFVSESFDSTSLLSLSYRP